MKTRNRVLLRRLAGGSLLPGLLVAGSLAAYAATPSGRAPVKAAADSTRPPRVYSIKDTPGYVPLVDSESTSVVFGRRVGAPLVRMPFKGGASSLADLGTRVCRALHRGERDSLFDLCITDAEFRDILWREFPQSRPATGVQWEDAWRILYARLHAGVLHSLRDHGLHAYELVSVKADSVANYRNFTLHSQVHVVVRDDMGQTQDWRWLRAVVERKGRFKIYSTDD